MGYVLNVFILTWKNFKLQLRHPWITFVEFFIPIFFMILLIFIRVFVPIEVRKLETVFDAYDLNSLPSDIYSTAENISLYYAPKTTFLDDLMQDVSASLNITVSGFNSEANLEDSYISSSSKIIAAVIFDSSLANGIHDTEPINYTIRLESIIGRSWNLSYAMPAFPLLEITDKSYHGTIYACSGFLAIQHAVAKSIISRAATSFEKSFDDLFTIEMNRQPYPPYVLDTFYKLSDYYIAAAFCLCYFFPSAVIAKNIVRETQTKLKETLLLMGLSNLEIWTAWFIKEFIFLLVSNIIISVMVCIQFNGAAVFNKSDLGVVLFWLCLYSANVIAFAFFIATFFKKGRGLKWSTIGDIELLNVVITMRTAFSMLAVNIAVYLILSWYIDVILQRNRPWYFPLMASYWTGQKNIPPYSPDTSLRVRQPTVYEGDLPKVRPMMHVKNLTKKYGKFPIVDNVDLKAYKGKITALLAHNCSGKSTFISMLYGALTPTSGIIKIKGLNMCNINEVRYIIPLLGICPEFDVCLEEMTVEENLNFFCCVKGFTFDVIKQEVNHILALFDLEIRKNLLVSMLSPSLKRRLSVAISLIGESEVVLLDEPTLHMDSSSQRLTWDALVLEKLTRAIFFTTSSIKEAYAYADRIAVFHDGYLKCCGSPMFLKKKYDAGYMLILFKEPEFNLTRIKSYISSRIRDVDVVTDTEEKVILKLPPDKCHLFENLLKGFEEQDWKIKQMSLAEIPLEKLFENDIIKRKLTVALAIVGMPPLILLEEPTAFMDPVACAETREAIKLAKNEGCTIVLSTQKMDDCEALTDRIGILV